MQVFNKLLTILINIKPFLNTKVKVEIKCFWQTKKNLLAG